MKISSKWPDGRNKKKIRNSIEKYCPINRKVSSNFNLKQLNLKKKKKRRRTIENQVGRKNPPDGWLGDKMETFLFCWRLSRTVRRKVRHGATRTISSRDTHTKKIIYNFVCVYPHAGREQEVAFGWGTPVQMTGGRTNKNPSACFRWCRSNFPSPTVDLGVFWT